MTTYYVDIEDRFAAELMAGTNDVILPVGWRVVRKVQEALRPAGEGLMFSRYLVEDDFAHPDLEGKLIEPEFRQIREPELHVVVTGRKVLE